MSDVAYVPTNLDTDGYADTSEPRPADDSALFSIADHESSQAPEAPEPDDTPAPVDERDARGQFKPRHRAASQRADADDVEAINAQTKRIKDAEARLGADIVKQAGESDRVYTLRRRAELLERQAPAPKATATAPPSTATPQPVQRHSAQPIPETFPAYDAFITIPGCENATYEDYADARADWRYARARESERARDHADKQQQTQAEHMSRYTAALSAAKAKYADFDTVVRADLMVNAPIGQAIMASEHGPEIAYLLAKNDALRAELNAEITDVSPATIAATRRYLDSLVAAQRPTTPPTRTAAGSTGAALALAPPPAPRPPTPVRTGSIAVADTPPDDDEMSLDKHEKHFGNARRR